MTPLEQGPWARVYAGTYAMPPKHMAHETSLREYAAVEAAERAVQLLRERVAKEE